MEINKEYYVKRLKIDGKLLPQEKCTLLKILEDNTCIVMNTDGQTRLFMLDMLSEEPDVVYGEMKSIN